MCNPMLTALFLAFFLGAEARNLAATSHATAVVIGPGSASSDCSATNGNTAICDSVAVSDGTRKAVAVSKGKADTADVVVQSVAKAIGGGDGDTIAVAIGEAVKSAGGGDKAAKGLSDVFVKAVNEGSGLAVAKGIADGVAKGGDVQKGIVAAIAKIVKEDGCDVIKPTLASAFAHASEQDNKQGFADAFDVDVQVSDCVYPHCADDRWHCCQSPDDDSKCSAYSVFKTTPRLILTCKDCDDKQCICPKA
ncbi:hypothetical protein BSKO_00691 [Bryopsis sp. KO-2023]|nr:hypothetical protein BSKO_00691 [Bryopsis sp. KO-2023]